MNKNLILLYVNGFPESIRAYDLAELFTVHVSPIKSVNIFNSTNEYGLYAIINCTTLSQRDKCVNLNTCMFKHDNACFTLRIRPYYQREEGELGNRGSRPVKVKKVDVTVEETVVTVVETVQDSDLGESDSDSKSSRSSRSSSRSRYRNQEE